MRLKTGWRPVKRLHNGPHDRLAGFESEQCCKNGREGMDLRNSVETELAGLED